MPKGREVFALLTRHELLAALDRSGLTVPDRRVRENVIDALVRSKGKVRLDEVLGGLSRDRLKEICRGLDLDDSGKEKAEIIARILGHEPKEDAPAEPRPSRAEASSLKKTGEDRRRGSRSGGKPKPESRSSRPETPEEVAAAAARAVAEGHLTVEALERYLWSAADILRGSIDSSDYKNFIFGLLFLKRLSDRFDEECEALRAEGADPEDCDEHQFFVPKRARWSEIRKVATGIGEALNKASGALEEANPSLEGVLASIDYNDERKLGDARARDAILGKLVLHFAQVPLGNRSLAEPDMLGRAYEYLIEKFADDAGKKGGEFYTPNMVVRLIVEILDPKEGMRIYDPTCGSGGMLIQSAQQIARSGGQPKNVSLFGQEKNLGTWAICKMNLLLHGYPDARIEKGDTIRAPKLLQDGELMLFDRVIANPPFSLDNWGEEEARADSFGRFHYGIPPKTKGDLAFVQHMVASMNPKGMLGVVMPHGVLFRGGAEGEIRKGLIDDDLIEAVIGLPSNLFYGTGIPAAVLVMNRAKPKERKGKVLFVEASREFREGSAQNYLRDEDVKKIARAVRDFRDAERYARVVPTDEIAKNDFNLNITRYVDAAEAEEKVDVATAVRKLREAERVRDEAKAKMDGFLKELGFE